MRVNNRGMAVILAVMLAGIVGPAGAADDVARLGNYEQRLMLSQYRVLYDDSRLMTLTTILQRLQAATGGPPAQAVLLNALTANAFADAGGTLYVTYGMLQRLENDENLLAALLAHEYHHLRGQHALNVLHQGQQGDVFGRALVANALTVALGVVAGRTGAGAAAGPALGQAARLLGNKVGSSIAVMMTNGYSRTQELEADEHAVYYLLAAGYPPQALVEVIGRTVLFETGDAGDHPGAAERQEKVRALLLTEATTARTRAQAYQPERELRAGLDDYAADAPAEPRRTYVNSRAEIWPALHAAMTGLPGARIIVADAPAGMLTVALPRLDLEVNPYDLYVNGMVCERSPQQTTVFLDVWKQGALSTEALEQEVYRRIAGAVAR